MKLRNSEILTPFLHENLVPNTFGCVCVEAAEKHLRHEASLRMRKVSSTCTKYNFLCSQTTSLSKQVKKHIFETNEHTNRQKHNYIESEQSLMPCCASKLQPQVIGTESPVPVALSSTSCLPLRDSLYL